MLLPLRKFHADVQELDLPLERIATAVPFMLEKSCVCFMFELPNLYSHFVIVCFIISCRSIDKVLPYRPLRIDEWQQEITLV